MQSKKQFLYLAIKELRGICSQTFDEKSDIVFSLHVMQSGVLFLRKVGRLHIMNYGQDTGC